MSRPIALVTGASSGIGKAYAVALAADGFDIIAVARREERLTELGVDLRQYGATTEPLVADLTSPDARERVSQRIRERDVAFVANIAGFGGYARYDAVKRETIDELIAVHVSAVAEFTHAAVTRCPAPTTVVNVGSLLALSGSIPAQPPVPARAIYAGAKAFMLTFTQALAGEAIPGLRVQVVVPGMVATEYNGGYSPEIAMSSADVVAASLAGLKRGEIVCVPGLDDETALERLKAAQVTVLTGGNRRPLASRYVVSPMNTP
jgi:short-subunit dehydrogenase